MSHFTSIATRITDLGCLKTALNYLELSWKDGPADVTDYYGNRTAVDLLVVTGSAYNFGFERAGNEYNIVGDWWGIERSGVLREKETVDSIRQRYAYEKVMREKEKLERQGYHVARTEITEEAVQVITLRRY